jgi:tetratricopeptide (TPR) repeat protein
MLVYLGRSIVSIRKEAFVKQNMGRSTVVNIRKCGVIVKTFYYYLKMLVLPKRLGLFHKWGYHYDEVIERFDGMFFKGLLSLAAMAVLFYFAPFPVKFGMVWLFSYLILFSNVITAQQFVADRYSFIPSLGFTIVLAYYFQNFEFLYWFVLGVWIMRCWVHLPTFNNEIEFYQSNVFNFPDSEVAYGNLGVVWNFSGCGGSAVDCWRKAIDINKFYDVPHYNLYSLMKNTGQLEQAEVHLKNCLNGKTVHFNEIWQKEYIQLQAVIARKKEVEELNKKLNEALNAKKYEEFETLKTQIIELQKAPIPIPKPVQAGS